MKCAPLIKARARGLVGTFLRTLSDTTTALEHITMMNVFDLTELLFYSAQYTPSVANLYHYLQ